MEQKVARFVGSVREGKHESEMADAFSGLRGMEGIPARQRGIVKRIIAKGMDMKAKTGESRYIVRAAAIRALHEMKIGHTEAEEKKLKKRLLEIAGEEKVENDEAAARAAICLTLKNWKHQPNKGHDNIRTGLLNGLKHTFISDEIGKAIREAGIPNKRIVAWLENGSAVETEAAAKYVSEWMKGKTTVPEKIISAMRAAKAKRENGTEFQQFHHATEAIGGVLKKLEKK